MTRVVVVGGGIAGLTAAWTLRNGPPRDPTCREDLDVTVVEAGDQVGGKLRTGTLAGQPFDLGAEAWLARRPEADRLAGRVGLTDRLVTPAQLGVWLWQGDRLRRFPQRTVLGLPADPAAVARSGVLSGAAVARVAAEPHRARTPLLEDATIAAALAPRLGEEAVATLVEPLLGGIYAGSTDRLSVMAATPLLAEAARSRRSLVAFARAHRRRTAHVHGPVFRTLAGGASGLADALATDLDVRTAVAATGIEQDDDAWVVHTTEGALPADAVVVATPSQPAAQLLAEVAPVSATALRAVPTASVATVATAWPAEHAVLPPGSGMLVPRPEGRLVKAATWSTNKWDHLGDDGLVRIRFSVGRVDDRRGLELDDRILTELVLGEGRAALGLQGEPVDVVVQRWPDGLPQYEVGHRDRVAAVVQGLPDGVHVTGALYAGIGVAPTIGHAEQVAATVRAGA